MRIRCCWLALLVCLFTAPVWSFPGNQWLEEGDRLWSENKLEDAEQAYRQAIAADPETAAAYARLGGLLLSQNYNQEAVEAYQNAIMHDPENARLFASISIACMHMGHYQMVQGMVNRALALDPGLENAQDLSRYPDAKMAALHAAPETATDEVPATPQ